MPKAKIVDYDFVANALVETGLRESSAKTYISKMKRILRLVFDTETPTIKQLKKGTTKIIDFVAEDGNFLNSNVRKVILMAVSHLYEVYDLPIGMFEKPVKEYTTLADAEAITNTKQDTIDKINTIDFDAIKESVKDIKDPTDRLITAFYSYLPPLRQQDLIGLHIITGKTEDKNPKGKKSVTAEKERNHINLKNNTMYIYEHKTSKVNGTKQIPIPFKLIDEIQRYMKDMKTRVLLPLSSSAFTRRMVKLFGVSTSIFRKAYVSQKAPKMNATELAELSRVLGHRISTQMISYRKNLTNEKQPEANSETDTDDDE